jgi:hypothetical protein
VGSAIHRDTEAIRAVAAERALEFGSLKDAGAVN